ncbi:MAG: redoxin domain-containing protein, partial [Bacteroidota bacterium]
MPVKLQSAAPAFKGIDQNNEPIALKDLKGSWVVLYFYPKDNTSGCTKQACDFRDSMKSLA